LVFQLDQSNYTEFIKQKDKVKDIFPDYTQEEKTNMMKRTREFM